MKKILFVFALSGAVILNSCGSREEGDTGFTEESRNFGYENEPEGEPSDIYGKEGTQEEESTERAHEEDSLNATESRQDEGLEEEDERQQDLEEARERDQSGYNPDPTGERQTSRTGRPAAKEIGEE